MREIVIDIIEPRGFFEARVLSSVSQLANCMMHANVNISTTASELINEQFIGKAAVC